MRSYVKPRLPGGGLMAKINVFKLAPGRHDPPFDPYVQLSLSNFSQDSAGRVFLSPQLASEMEIDESVDDLMKQLEKARKKAKEYLKKAKGEVS
jgi:hypothetical protein